MSGDDRSYYQHRAEIELERARQSKQPQVARLHYQMAEAYLGKVASTEPVMIVSS